MLLGKTLAITGVSSGIGKRTAELALSMGANVVGIDLNPPPQPLGAYIKADLATKSGIKDVVAQLPQQIDGLLAIAGVSGKTGAQHTMAVNFYGLRTLAESVAPRIRQGGAVVSIASFAGYGWRSNLERTKKLLTVDFPDAKKLEELGCPNELGYPISKEVLILWTQKAAHQPVFRERGVRVVSVSPGPVETPILTQFREVLGWVRGKTTLDSL